MFLRIVSDSFTRKPRRKMLTAAALALGMAVATATLEVALDVGDRLAREFRSLGANLLVTPASDTLPLEIGGVDYRPVDAGAYLPEGDLGKLKTIFWRNNVMGFAPFLDVPVAIASAGSQENSQRGIDRHLVQPLRQCSRRQQIHDGNFGHRSLVACRRPMVFRWRRRRRGGRWRSRSA